MSEQKGIKKINGKKKKPQKNKTKQNKNINGKHEKNK